MKKLILGSVIMIMVLSLGLASAFATEKAVKTTAGKGTNTHRAHFVDRDGDGVCDNQRHDKTHKSHFIDKDGDGVCDNQRHSSMGSGHKSGQGTHHGNGKNGGHGAGRHHNN